MSSWATGKIRPLVLDVRHSNHSVCLELGLDADLFQFQGHFPNHPILPGVAQLDWAVRFSSEYLELSCDIRQVTKLKFKQLVLPEDPIALQLDYAPSKHCVMFEYRDHQGAPCSSGIIHLDPAT
ncbi:hypothetical protein [Halocynthiibacter namhaensis]|uniref:ApeI family dehydratase n=1 Tax=Halocynthiibacter namhaensis TaxID=1290553 RepID=UPI000578F273